MLCSRCGKRQAVVFVSENKADSTTKGYCLTCAKELGIKPVEDLISKMGITEDDLESVQEQMNSIMSNLNESGDLSQLMEGMDMENLAETMNTMNEQMENNDDFTPGGAPAFPAFFLHLLE